MKHFNTYINEFLVKNHVNDRRMEYVDLDLPSGTVWAACNLGANSPSERGDYYMFGATEPSDTCDWSNCPYNGDSDEFDYKFFQSHQNDFLDKDGKLLDSSDAAAQILNDGSHIPTVEQLEELFENTIHTPIRRDHIEYRKYNTAGMKLSSKKDKSKSIFIPYSHMKIDRHVTEAYDFVLWSNSIDEESIDAAEAYASDYRAPFLIDIERFIGGTIRPVKDKL